MSAPKDDLLGLAESLVGYGRKKGASEIEVTIAEGTEFDANVREGELESLTEAGSKGLALRVLVDGKLAEASSSDFAKATLTHLVDNAIVRARLGGKDEFAGLPEKQEIKGDVAKLGIHDPAIAAMPPEKKIAVAKKLEAIGVGDKRVQLCLGSSYSSYEGRRILVNSKGFSGSYRRSIASCGVGFQAGEGDNVFQDYYFDATTKLADLKDPETIAKKAVERVTRLVGARKVETQNVPLILEPAMTAQLLGFLSQCLSGPALARKQSFLVDALGTTVGNELVTIVDDGLLPRGRGTRPFDSEGVPASKKQVVAKGVLKSYLLDTYWGKKLGLSSTGNADGATNLYWQAGTSTPEEIIKSVDKGLLLTGTLGLGTVPTTGDWSVGAFGLWIEKGEVAFPVAEITISGNLGELLGKVEMVGNDLELRRSIAGPTVKFSEISVGGTAPAKAEA